MVVFSSLKNSLSSKTYKGGIHFLRDQEMNHSGLKKKQKYAISESHTILAIIFLFLNHGGIQFNF